MNTVSNSHNYPCGHPRTDKNSYYGSGAPRCLACKRIAGREYRKLKYAGKFIPIKHKSHEPKETADRYAKPLLAQVW